MKPFPPPHEEVFRFLKRQLMAALIIQDFRLGMKTVRERVCQEELAQLRLNANTIEAN